ncbi:aminotransferase class I/II-fold pyridoxal phosphate-dependent enzyme [Corynebacterium heidelbergense]|nr:8-amino-7-oxononanoate synthase [Corynebacterium heidelbergense]WCZ37538.1 8-amino-7-oxononanoate synthase [Corynebacterium heidelbergense]
MAKPAGTQRREEHWRHLAQRLAAWEGAGLGRTMVPFDTAQDPEAIVDGQRRLLFSSSNYLGLATHPKVLAAAQRALLHYGAGSGGSRLTTGTTREHLALEADLAEWLGFEDCAFFATGFAANLAAVSTYSDADTVIFSDERNHASLIDGCRSAKKADLVIYPHRDLRALDTAMAQRLRAGRRGLLVSDGVFSMDGTLADVAGLMRLCQRHGCLLLIDDAHGIGTVGDGRGCAMKPRPDILVGTASKALGAEGGFVCGPRDAIQLLRNQGRSFVFSTANAAPIIAAARAAVEVIRTDPGHVRRLQSNVSYLHRGLVALGLNVPEPYSPIVPIPLGDETVAMGVAASLTRKGLHVPAIRYPTVPRGAAILRITVMSTHRTEQIDALLGALADTLPHHCQLPQK